MKVTFVFEIDEEELEEFEDTNGDLYDWAFAEICQNQGFGFLTNIYREESK